jgi:hypothetical protein
LTLSPFPSDYLKVRSVKLDEQHYLVFDVFARNNELIAIGPVYPDYPIQVASVQFSISIDGQTFSRVDTECIRHEEQEGFGLWKHSLQSNATEFFVRICYKESEQTFKLRNYAIEKQFSFACAALFKSDTYLVKNWHAYYSSAGIDIFFLYFNGTFTNQIPLPQNAILMDWDFRYYWNDEGWHHAQVAQLHHTLYKFAKPACEFVLNCDLDEFFFCDDGPIRVESLQKAFEPAVGAVEFINHWSYVIDMHVPKCSVFNFRRHVMYDPVGSGQTRRTKYAYRTSRVESLGVHHVKQFLGQAGPKSSDGYFMLHFLNWSNSWRTKPSEPCNFERFPHKNSSEFITAYFRLIAEAKRIFRGGIRRLKRTLLKQ